MSAVATGDLTNRFASTLKRAFKPAPRRYAPWVWLNIISAVAIGWVIVYSYIESTWHFGVAPVVKCLPEDYFLISQSRPERIEAGTVYRFVSNGLGPVIKDKTPLVKMAAAVPGDRVEVSGSGIFINGRKWGDLNPAVMKKAGVSASTVTSSYVVPEGKVLMLGTLPRSYDGRYFGLIDSASLTGKAIPLW